MSVMAIALALDRVVEADPLAKLLLVLLANARDPDTGTCRINAPALAAAAGCAASTVAGKIQLLEVGGHLHLLGAGACVLTFAPGPARLDAYQVPAKATRAPKRPTVPDADFWPSADSIDKIRKEFPHHETDDRAIGDHVANWIDWCAGSDRRFVEHDAAWRNSARGFYKRHSQAPALHPTARNNGRAAGGVLSAISDLLGERAG
jgi:hypothetical protein